MKIWKVEYKGFCKYNFVTARKPPRFDKTVVLQLPNKSSSSMAHKKALRYIEEFCPEWVFEECKNEKPYITDISTQTMLVIY